MKPCSARVKASLIAAETPVASAEPCDLMTVPLSPRKTPPLARRGSMRFCSRFSEVSAKRAPIRDSDRVGEGFLEQALDHPGGALAGLERDVAGEAVGDDDVDPVGGHVAALDVADVLEVAAGCGRGDALGRLVQLGAALVLLGADVEEADARAGERRGRCGRRRRPSPRT